MCLFADTSSFHVTTLLSLDSVEQIIKVRTTKIDTNLYVPARHVCQGW